MRSGIEWAAVVEMAVFPDVTDGSEETRNLVFTQMPPHRGQHTDRLLAVAETIAGRRDDASACHDVRRIIRSQRPAHEFIWNQSAESIVLRVAGRCAEPLRELLVELRALISGELDPLDIDIKWKRQYVHAFDANLEYEPFLTTRSLDDVLEKFYDHLSSKNSFDLVLRGHLWLETAVTTLIKRELRRPERLDQARLGFSQRLTLAQGLGLVSDDEARVINAVNRLRNKMAHSLEFEIDMEDGDALVSSCNKGLKEIAGAESETTLVGKISAVIAALVFALYRRIDAYDAKTRYDAFVHQVVVQLKEEAKQRGP